MVQVWEASVKRRYVAPLFSGSYCFKFVSYAAWYIAPFFIAYASYCTSCVNCSSPIHVPRFKISARASLAPPLLSCTAFWKTFNTYREQPTVHPTHDFLLLVQGTASGVPFSAFWSTVPEMNALVANSQLRAPTVSQVRAFAM